MTGLFKSGLQWWPANPAMTLKVQNTDTFTQKTSLSSHVQVCVRLYSFLPDVWLCAAVPCQLVLGEVCVVGGGDEVVCQWVLHVLVNPGMLWVKYTVLLRQHIHGETIGGHELVLLGCTGQKGQTQMISLFTHPSDMEQNSF